MKLQIFSIFAILLGVHSASSANQSPVAYQLVPKVIDDVTQYCGIDNYNNLTFLSPNYGSVSISFFDDNGYPLLANQFYRDYSAKSKLFIYKYNVKSYPKNIIINGAQVGECR